MLTFLALALAALVSFVLWKTPAGLAVRAVGENPAAAEAQGIDPTRVRILAVVAGSAIMAIGGAFLTMSAFNALLLRDERRARLDRARPRRVRLVDAGQGSARGDPVRRPSTPSRCACSRRWAAPSRTRSS
jgi:hypothetical protein